MSKYDSIATAKDLIREVISHGLSIDIEDKNRAADILGNSSIRDLADLANSTDTISGKHITDTFYFIAFNVWNWRDAVNFFNEHTNPATKTARETAEKLKAAENDIEKLTADYKGVISKLNELGNQNIEEYNKVVHVTNALEAAQGEVITLKAKLYDLMTAVA